MPTSLQYPLERQRDVQRRWNRLLERTITPKDHLAEYPRASLSPCSFRGAMVPHISPSSARKPESAATGIG